MKFGGLIKWLLMTVVVVFVGMFIINRVPMLSSFVYKAQA